MSIGKIDEVKEILNTLRVAMSLAFGVFVLIAGKIAAMYDQQNLMKYFGSVSLHQY